MAERFTGFWEATGPDTDEMGATITSQSIDYLLERLRARLQDIPPGTHVRIDLIASDPDD